MISLDEYIQRNGDRKTTPGSVELNPDDHRIEISKWSKDKLEMFKVRHIYIKLFDVQYIQTWNNETLMVQDEDGNQRARSVFSLKLK